SPIQGCRACDSSGTYRGGFDVLFPRLPGVTSPQIGEAKGARRDRLGTLSDLRDRKSTRLNSSHEWISYAVFCLKKKESIESQGAGCRSVQRQAGTHNAQQGTDPCSHRRGHQLPRHTADDYLGRVGLCTEAAPST